MDEPTNDLDIDTLELLEERIAQFDGTLLLVSHDRAFLDRVVTSLLVLEGDGKVREFIGGWSDWRSWRDSQPDERKTAASRREEPRREATPKRRKLSFNEQREFDALPTRIEQLEAEKAALDARVAEPAFYGRPHDEVRETLRLLQAMASDIEVAYARWAELESRQSTAS
jgi:ATP-binding cassette subfamily F protein uup